MITRMIRALAAVSFLLSVSATAFAQDAAPPPLSLAQAITTALAKHPSLRATAAQQEAAAAGVTQALAGYFPALSVVMGYTHTEGAFVFNPSFPPREQIYSNYSAGVQAQQLVFDFGRTINKVSSGGEVLRATEQDHAAMRATVIANVEIAYFSLWQALQVVQANASAVAQAEKHLAQAEAYYKVGRRPQFDVTKAEVDLANARVGLIRARNQVDLARVQLDNAMGVRGRAGGVLSDSLTVSGIVLDLDSLKTAALHGRPELLAAQWRAASSRSLVSAASSQRLPVLNATGNYTWSGFDFPLASRWIAGLTLSFPLFQGFSIDAQVRLAEANATAAQASFDALQEAVLLELEQSFLALSDAQARMDATAKLVEQAEQNALLAERQYMAGTGTPLEASDAELALLNARVTRIQAVTDINSALVRILRGTGAMNSAR